MTVRKALQGRNQTIKQPISISIYLAFIWSTGITSRRIWNLSIQK